MHFLGHVSERTKFEELARAWVHVLPSVKEGWGLSIVEAGRVGTPSVAYGSAGGVPSRSSTGSRACWPTASATSSISVRDCCSTTCCAETGRQGGGAHRAAHLGQRHRDHKKRAPGLSLERVDRTRPVSRSLVGVRNAGRVGLLDLGGAHVAVRDDAAEDDGRRRPRPTRPATVPSIRSLPEDRHGNGAEV